MQSAFVSHPIPFPHGIRIPVGMVAEQSALQEPHAFAL